MGNFLLNMAEYGQLPKFSDSFTQNLDDYQKMQDRSNVDYSKGSVLPNLSPYDSNAFSRMRGMF